MIATTNNIKAAHIVGVQAFFLCNSLKIFAFQPEVASSLKVFPALNLYKSFIKNGYKINVRKKEIIQIIII